MPDRRGAPAGIEPATCGLGRGTFSALRRGPHLRGHVTSPLPIPLATLDVVQYQLMRMAAGEGWATAPLAAAYRACVADDLELHLVSKPKASPDRRLKAYVAYTVDGNGDGRTTLHVEDRSGVAVYRGEAWESPCGSDAFARIGRSLRWLGLRTVNVFTWPGVPPPKKHFPIEQTVELPIDQPTPRLHGGASWWCRCGLERWCRLAPPSVSPLACCGRRWGLTTNGGSGRHTTAHGIGRLGLPSSEGELPDRGGAPGRNRTCDLRFRKPLLYPLSYEGASAQSSDQRNISRCEVVRALVRVPRAAHSTLALQTVRTYC